MISQGCHKGLWLRICEVGLTRTFRSNSHMLEHKGRSCQAIAISSIVEEDSGLLCGGQGSSGPPQVGLDAAREAKQPRCVRHFIIATKGTVVGEEHQ